MIKAHRLVALLALASCASHRNVRPYLSVAEHETTAATLERSADEHTSRFVPASRESACRAGRHAADACWTSVTNPTAAYLKHASEHRRLAAEHRAAARALRDAEASACAGIADEDRDESPFDHREDVLRVEPLLGADAAPWTEGVVVTFRPIPGMTAPWLQRVVDCQIARNAALGNDVPDSPHCLLVPKGVRAVVTAVPEGFAVTIRAPDRSTAEEIFRRADALIAAGSR